MIYQIGGWGSMIDKDWPGSSMQRRTHSGIRWWDSWLEVRCLCCEAPAHKRFDFTHKNWRAPEMLRKQWEIQFMWYASSRYHSEPGLLLAWWMPWSLRPLCTCYMLWVVWRTTLQHQPLQRSILWWHQLCTGARLEFKKLKLPPS